MRLLLKKIKRNGLTNSVKKFISFGLYQKTRVYFYKLISLNKPELYEVRINQPVYFTGAGRVVAKKVNFGRRR